MSLRFLNKSLRRKNDNNLFSLLNISIITFIIVYFYFNIFIYKFIKLTKCKYFYKYHLLCKHK